MKTRPLVTAGFALVCLGAALGLALPRLELAAPTWVQVLLCHAVHRSPTQLFYAAGASLAFAALYEMRVGSARALALALIGAGGAAAAVLLTEGARLFDYCGASGLGHAFAAAAVLAALPRPWRLLAFAALAAKVGGEVLSGRILSEAGLAGGVPVPIAHLGGFLAGSLGALVLGGFADGGGREALENNQPMTGPLAKSLKLRT